MPNSTVLRGNKIRRIARRRLARTSIPPIPDDNRIPTVLWSLNLFRSTTDTDWRHRPNASVLRTIKKIQNNNNKVGLHVTYIRVGHCAQTTIADGGDDTDWFHFINRYCYRVFISDSDVLDDDDHRRRRRWTVLENSL